MADARGRDPKLPPGSAVCRCAKCGEYFRSDKGFQKHRKDGACLTPEEMRRKGMEQNDGGYWITEPYTARRPTP